MMQAAHDGGWLPQASGTTLQVGFSDGAPLPPSGGRVPGNWPSTTQISPPRHFRVPQSVPHAPALAVQLQLPDCPEPTH
jgi:hypothetical protein